MAVIVQKENPVLREQAREVPLAEIQTPAIKKVLRDMKEALNSQEDGVAIAAPQIAVPLRIFIVSGRVFEILKGQDDPSAGGVEIKAHYDDIVFINPKITKLSKAKKKMEEGCLSVRYLYGKVDRSTKATVEAYDETGKKFTKGGSGLMAQIFQHEVDHLDGTLFIDKATDIEDIPPKK